MRKTSQENYRPVSLMNMEEKNPQNILATNQIQQHTEKYIHHDKMEFISGT